MIIVVISSSIEAARGVFATIKSEHQGPTAALALHDIPSQETRERHIAAVKYERTESFITVVVNPKTVEEVAQLRAKGAVICHHVDALASIHKQLPILRTDLVFTTRRAGALNSALTVGELLSECKIMHRKSIRQGR
ncbi:hypothetical protein [Pseudoalteromonas ruthenica]|uniref:hypothetical protein n=1 Tax=Pseudoalteromonas ruthenica TaxID=151081 RepID=UPI00110BDEF0|nr:hypothetical protein [Pseudoalteromonas ruthenica]TMP23756.1 hypothetical protein CWC06_09385 [Pseudoalteromonas ruthenica]